MRKFAWAALCSSLVAACGGGGGGSTPLAATVAVSSTNQSAVARTSVSAVASVASAGGGVTGSSGGAGVAALPGGWSRQVALAMSGSRKAVLASGAAQPLASQPATVSCGYSGSITLTVNDANNNGQPDGGDSLTLTLNNCKSTATDNASGSIAIVLTSYATTSAGANFAGTMTLNVVATEGARSATVAGTVDAAYTDLSTTQSRTLITVGSGALTGSVTAGGSTETITYDAGFSIAETDTTDAGGTPLSSSTTVSGSLSSSVLAGRIVLETTAPIVQAAADAYPSSGTLRATGASGSALVVTALSATQVQLQLDADGNGSYEATTTLPWSTVLPG